MSKKLAVGLLLMLINPRDGLTQPPKLWAMVNEARVTTVILDGLKKADPSYEADQQRFSEYNVEQNDLHHELLTLERLGKQKCTDLFLKKTGNTQTFLFPRLTGIGAKASGTAILEAVDEVVRANGILQQKLQADPDYNDCIGKIRQNPLFQTLQATEAKYGPTDAMRQEFGKRQNWMMKQAKNLFEKAVNRYAEKHGYRFIMNAYPNDILYNQNKVILDVTDDVLDFIKKNPPMAAAPK